MTMQGIREQKDWELDHTDNLLQALSTGISDHAPLHLTTNAPFFHKKRFRIEMFWLKLEGFEDVVREALRCDERITDPFQRLNAMLRNTAAALQAWGQRKTSNIKLQMAVANWIVFRFDKAMEDRQLTELERWLRNTLKLALLALASLQHTIDRQRSRFRWLKEGDANTKFFHAFANGRRVKNFIPLIKHGDEVITNPDRMEQVFSETYQAIIGTAHARQFTLDLNYLGMEPLNLEDLEAIFTEEEVWAVIKELHPDRAPGPDGGSEDCCEEKQSVFLKLDISRAFDSLSWPFLFEVLKAKGFGNKWIKWVSILLQSATTKILVNGVPGRSIAHACGLRQGDSVSPLLFVIAMDALTTIIGKALEQRVLSAYRGISAWQRVSIYADDVALFVHPTITDLSFTKHALYIFGEASGLKVNYLKSTATLIHGDQEDKERVVELLQCKLAEFPCRYLGLQLAIKQLTKQYWQPLLDMVRKCMPAWHRGLVQRAGRLVLAKSVISARPIHQLLVLQPPAWVLEDINSWMRSFFWAGEDKVNGGQCLVAWDRICRPVQYGGLGIKNLKAQALALRVRWEWLRRTKPERPWQGLGMLVDQEARAVFDCLVHIEVGRGDKVLFWKDRRIHGHSVQDIAPLILELVETRRINTRTVQWALEDEQWSMDAPFISSHMALLQLMHLRHAIASVHRDDQLPDNFLWPCATSMSYSAKSTYNRLCEGLPDEDTVDHILVQCGYARGTWMGCFDKLQLQITCPTSTGSFLEWWMQQRSGFAKEDKHGFNTLVICTAWSLWKQRNARVFNRTEQQVDTQELVVRILDEMKDWKLAARGGGSLQRFVRE
ncbi:uncharacterized protein [Aegilops tauschii subsp. strangulata]|uniref:uncharacterized protein n=1 Tax=Aegilops tauschii subsp. strangulata TaxID=200361 RepID=UPI003CC85116